MTAPWWCIRTGDVLDGLAALPDRSVNCVVTSPPYWGLRDYGVAGQIGLEPSPAEYVARMVAVFREVRRVLSRVGTLWLNVGDCYAAQRSGTIMPAETLAGGAAGKGSDGGFEHRGRAREGRQHHRDAGAFGLKHKDLVGVPWRLALALQDDGWWLRQDIIWHKPNPMPESVRDRCTKAHEYLFLLSRSARYYFDTEAIAEPAASAVATWPTGWAAGDEPHNVVEFSGQVGRSGNRARVPAAARGVPGAADGATAGAVAGNVPWEGYTRNRRSVWTIPTEAFPGAHFATFPTALVEPCILAGCPAGGIVLDPFAGSGTAGVVALRLGRSFVGLELNPAYSAMARDRIRDDSPLFNVPAEVSEPFATNAGVS